MNRLQKKCVIATAGFHLLLLVILFVGPAFFNPKPKADDSQVLDVIPANLIDAAFNSGVKNATPPAPAPVVAPQPTPSAPPPTLMQKVEKLFAPEPTRPAPAPVEIQPRTPKVDLHLVTRDAPKNSVTPKPKDDSQSKLRAEALRAARVLKNNLSPTTTVEMPGNSSAAYANYASAVKSVYDQAWMLPDTIAKDENTTVSVTIASDGTVINARILTPSGDAPVDNSVQRALNRVRFVAPFPEGTADKQRTYTIIFNPQVKSSE
jgi:TonB family protein